MPEVTFESRFTVNHKAQFAMELMRTNSILLGKEDGEDSTGRAKLKQASPAEIVDRAVRIADLAFDAFAEHGWLHNVTKFEDVLDAVDKYQEAEKELEKTNG
jgi:hypothetical protein